MTGGADAFRERGTPPDRLALVSRLCTGLVLILMGAALVRTVQLQIAPEPRLAEFVTERLSSRTRDGARGDIIDRRGRLLAASRIGYRLFIDPSMLEPPYGQLIADLSSVTGMPTGEVATRILTRVERSNRRVSEGKPPLRYVSVGRVLSDEQYFDALELDHPGLHLEERLVREYPADELVGSLIGKVGVDHDGLLGVELSKDGMLEPETGTLTYTRDARGNPLWVSEGAYRHSTKGQGVRLSLDLALQEIAREELIRGVEEANAAGGRLVMADPHTGEILAMVDHVREMEGLATFDMGNPPPREVTDKGKTRFRTIRGIDPSVEIHPAMRRNRCVEDLYEPGSTFKPFIWSLVTEHKLASPDERINTHKGLWRTSYGRQLRDVAPRDSLTWAEVLVHSSNIGMAQVAERMDYRDTRRGLERFGFGDRTRIGLPGESTGLLTPISRWSKYTQTSVSMGYEVGVTPVQMVRSFSAFARSGEDAGTIPPLTLTTEDVAHDAGVRYRVLAPWVVKLAREAMARVADAMVKRYVNTRDNPDPFAYSIFGKSGTAEIVRPDGRGYFRNQHNSSFLAAAPTRDPRVVVLVIIDDPGPERVANRTHFGSATAGPVVCRVVERTLRYMGVSPAPKSQMASAEE